MKTLIDIVDNGRRLVSVEYTNEDLAKIKREYDKRQAILQRQYDIDNQNTIKSDPLLEEASNDSQSSQTEEQPAASEP